VTATTQPERVQASPEELRWARQVDRFAAALVVDLRRLERLTGGGPKAGVAGRRLDPRIFATASTRRQFESTMTALAVCGASLDAAVPEAPTARLRSVRATLAHACAQLELVPELLREAVLRAQSPRDVDRASVAAAAGRADEGVRSVVDGLATMRRVLGA